MCGITGFLDFKHLTTKEVLSDMVTSLRHRGPDDTGCEIIEAGNASIGLAQARLSIIDISHSGHQPMFFDGLAIVFNGEIYNYAEIRQELIERGHQFQSKSDTEVILHAYREWGLMAINKFIGMFAFVIHDSKKNELIISRDRAGVKPFYYYSKGDLFLFGSELKSLLQHPRFEAHISAAAVHSFFDLGYVPAPQAIFENTWKLLPGHTLKINLNDRSTQDLVYWDVALFYTAPKLTVSYEEAQHEVHELLKSSCQYRMVSDVPVGVFLSGGYDSTAVAAILQKNRNEKLKTFTIGFEHGNNEAPYAKQTAAYLGTDHQEWICTNVEAKSIVPDLPYFFDEPFADQSAIPTILVSRLARQSVTVALSADGGDEIFAGYSRYQEFSKRIQAMQRVPHLLRLPAKHLLSVVCAVLPQGEVATMHRLQGMRGAIHNNNRALSLALYKAIHSLPLTLRNRVFYQASPTPSFQIDQSDEFANEIEMAMAIDFKFYLQNDILTKVDRATMSVSLEGREPLLDHRLIEYVARLPYNFKNSGQTQKRILKDIVHQYVPEAMMNRPKTGFSVPIFRWLRSDLNYLIKEYISPEKLSHEIFKDVDFVMNIVKKFEKGDFYYKPFIWRLLMFQMWYCKWNSR